MRGRMAVLIPVRNGGKWLCDSVRSCGAAQLAGDEAEVLVLDNCSDDGAPAALPSVVGRSMPVRVIRNERDLGRVGNWNRGVAAARERGFEFVTFLFAGDTWVAGEALRELLDLMGTSGSDLGLAPYLTVDENGRTLRRSARISFPGTCKVLSSEELFAAMMRRGHLPITPLQANIYCLRSDGLPRFDERRPLTTDMDATVEYLARRAASISLTARPFCAWLARKGRVFCYSGLESFMADHFRQLRHAEELSDCPLDWTRAKSVFLLGYLRNCLTFGGWRQMPHLLRSALAQAGCEPGTIDPVDLAGLAIRRLAMGRSSLHLA